MDTTGILICYDPGATTGVARFDDGHLVWATAFRDHKLIKTHIVSGCTVLYERLTWRNPAFNPIGLETIGVIKYIADLCGATCVSRPPTVLKGPRTWPQLEGFRKLVKCPHTRDAIGHGIAYLGLDNVVLPSGYMLDSPSSRSL